VEENLSDYHTEWDLGLAPFSFDFQSSKTPPLAKTQPKYKERNKRDYHKSKNVQKIKKPTRMSLLNIKLDVQDFAGGTDNFFFSKHI